MAKARLYRAEEAPVAANAALWTLKTVLSQALKMLHPFMPFVTEEIYSVLVPEEESLMISEWPKFREDWAFDEEEAFLEQVKAAVRSVRNMRAEMNVPNSRKTKIFIVSEQADIREKYELVKNSYMPLMNVNEVLIRESREGIPEDAVSLVIENAVLYIPLDELVDKEAELERLTKEEQKLTKELARSKGMLSNERFLSKAPEAKVNEEKEKLAKYEQMMAQVQERLAQLR
jgi:valyl-tRNA synthetase